MNDITESGIQLIENYNQLITKNEDQKQYLMQIVSEYGRRFSDYKKSALYKHFLLCKIINKMV